MKKQTLFKILFLVALVVLTVGMNAVVQSLSAKTLIVAIGDSITYSMTREGVMGHRVTIFGGWVTMLQNKLQEEFPDEYQVLNKGIRGDTAQGVFNRLHGDVISLQPSIVIVAIGTNDTYGFAGVNIPARNSVDYRAIMDKIFNELTQNLPDTSVFIMGMTTPLKKYIDIAGLDWAVPFQQEFLDTQFEEYNNVLKDLVQKYRYFYVDIRSKWPKDIEGSWEFYSDGIHPNDAGNNKMMEILYAALRSTVVHPVSVKSGYKLTTTWGWIRQ